jgi:hypothetical protein
VLQFLPVAHDTVPVPMVTDIPVLVVDSFVIVFKERTDLKGQSHEICIYVFDTI